MLKKFKAVRIPLNILPHGSVYEIFTYLSEGFIFKSLVFVCKDFYKVSMRYFAECVFCCKTDHDSIKNLRGYGKLYFVCKKCEISHSEKCCCCGEKKVFRQDDDGSGYGMGDHCNVCYKFYCDDCHFFIRECHESEHYACESCCVVLEEDFYFCKLCYDAGSHKDCGFD